MLHLLLKEGKDVNIIYIYRLAQYIFNCHKKNVASVFNKMKTINPKCSDNYSFKYSILISLHYYDLYNNKERINKLNILTIVILYQIIQATLK